MKINSKMKTGLVKKTVPSAAVKPSSWMTTGSGIGARMAASASRQDRAPEVWLKPDQEIVLRFRTSEPIACFDRYSIPGPGGRWEKYTRPVQGKRDLFADCGKKASSYAYYEVIDKTGYTDRKGEPHKDIPRLFVANGKVYQQLQKLRQKVGPLSGYDIEVSKQGSGVNSMYTFFPKDPTPMPEKFKKMPSLVSNMAKWYTPPSEEQQRSILGNEVVQEETYES
jgi:hypothetical protein